MAFNKLIANLESINVTALFLQVLNDHESDIQALLKMQLRQGLKGNGQMITPGYSNAYAKKKKSTIPDLKLSGKFYDSIYTEIDGSVLKVDSDRKENSFDLGKHLQKRYTTGILELTSKSRDKLGSLIKNDLQNKVKYEIYR